MTPLGIVNLKMVRNGTTEGKLAGFIGRQRGYHLI